MGVCIGFLVGLSIAGEIENANDFAESLIRSLSHLNQTLMFGDTKVPISYCNLTRDRTAMGFSFLKTSLLDNLSLEAAVVWDGTKLTINGQEQWYERYNGKVYVKLYNGGLLFHGLNNSIFAVSISTVKGWQIHT